MEHYFYFMTDTLLELQKAEEKAAVLFQEIENKGLIKAGKTEKQINTEVFELADELFGIKKYWHKRIVRAGKNTLYPYEENPEDLTIKEDDIIFIDFGPILEEWEADFGRTYVLGNDLLKLKIKDDTEKLWKEANDYLIKNPDITGAQLYQYCTILALNNGWEYGGPIAGHLIGHFPHEQLDGEDKTNYIHPENHIAMNQKDVNGNNRFWIIEIHLIDRKNQIGAFYEQLAGF